LKPKLPNFPSQYHGSPEWITQHVFPGGQIDMLADFGNFAFIFEHKVWSHLSPGQLDKYRDYAKENKKWLNDHNSIILITGSTHDSQDNTDLLLTWSNIHKFLSSWLKEHPDDLVSDFIDMLTEENLGPPAPVSYESITHYFTAQSFERNLINVTSKAAKEEDWTLAFRRIGFNKEKEDVPVFSKLIKLSLLKIHQQLLN